MSGTTPPMGIEVQATYFGFSQGLVNAMFVRWKIINKSDADYDSLFVSLWSDTDLGDGNDDMTGCDTTLDLTYAYNGGAVDAEYGIPPADGFVILQGPAVPGLPTDSALSEGVWKKGTKNLRAFSNVGIMKSSPPQDPPLADSTFPGIVHGYQVGINGYTGQPFIDPTTNQPSRFMFWGDPVTESGWTMTKSGFSPRDIRSMISAGPITLARQDTQEIVGAFDIAQGSDRLNSVTLLRQSVDIVRQTFLANFSNVPSVTATLGGPPANPAITIICNTKNSSATAAQATIRKKTDLWSHCSLFLTTVCTVMGPRAIRFLLIQ